MAPYLSLLLYLLWSVTVPWVFILHILDSFEAFCRMFLTWGWSGVSRQTWPGRGRSRRHGILLISPYWGMNISTKSSVGTLVSLPAGQKAFARPPITIVVRFSFSSSVVCKGH